MIICKTPRDIDMMEVAMDMQRLFDVTEESLFRGLKEANPGECLSNISDKIQTYVEESGFSIVRKYAGH